MAPPTEKLNVVQYFEQEETNRPMELVYGVVREPAMPSWSHQLLATRLAALLYAHVEEHGLGEVTAPVDVVLDAAAALVVQPDIVFVSRERLGIVRERVFGPPDLVVEVLSRSTARRDRTVKLAWYRQYGVHECWLVDARRGTIEVVDFQSMTPARLFQGDEPIRSQVLPQWGVSAGRIFA